MSFNDNIFTKIGKKLASSNMSVNSDIHLDMSTESNITLSNLSRDSININNSVKNTLYFTESQIYSFDIIYFNDNIQIKIINLITMDHYSDLLDRSFIKDIDYIRTLRILFNMLKDAIEKKNISKINLIYKLSDSKGIQLNLEHCTEYDKYIIPINIPIQEMPKEEKQQLLIEKLVKNNIELQNRLTICEKKISELDL